MSVVTRYNVRKADGSMTFSQTEAQKDKIVGAGGSVVNVIKMPGREPRPPPPPAPPPTSPDDLVLQAHVTGVEQTLKDQLELFAAGEITQEQLVARKTALEEGHLDWYTEFEKTGATGVEKEQIITARADESAKQLESTVEQILTMEAEGEISHEQSVAAVKHFQEEQLVDVKDILSGEDVKAGESGLSLGYTFKEVPEEPGRVAVDEVLQPVTEVPVAPAKIITTTVWTAKLIDADTGEVIKEEKFDSERDAKLWTSYQIMAITRLPTIEEERKRELVEEVQPEVGTVTIDPNLVTYMGITMTRDQFEADFPPDTIPDTVVKTATTPVDVAKAYEDTMSVIPDSLRESSQNLGQASLDLAAAGKPVEGFLSYLGGLVHRETALAYDVATFLIRPELWRQQAQAIGYLLAADKPETRSEHNQRIADFVVGDIQDPVMQKEVTEFLQTTIPFTPQDQEYLDKAKEFRKAFGEQIAADPFAFALDVGVSFYTGKLVGKTLSGMKGSLEKYFRDNKFGGDFAKDLTTTELRRFIGMEELTDAQIKAELRNLGLSEFEIKQVMPEVMKEIPISVEKWKVTTIPDEVYDILSVETVPITGEETIVGRLTQEGRLIDRPVALKYGGELYAKIMNGDALGLHIVEETVMELLTPAQRGYLTARGYTDPVMSHMTATELGQMMFKELGDGSPWANIPEGIFRVGGGKLEVTGIISPLTDAQSAALLGKGQTFFNNMVSGGVDTQLALQITQIAIEQSPVSALVFARMTGEVSVELLSVIDSALAPLASTIMTSVSEGSHTQTLKDLGLSDSEAQMVTVELIKSDQTANIVKSLTKLTESELKGYVPGVDKGLLLESIPKLDAKTIQNLAKILDTKTIVKVVPKIKPDVLSSLLVTIDEKMLKEVLSKVEKARLKEILKEIDKPTLEKVTKVMDIKTLEKTFPALGTKLTNEIFAKFDLKEIETLSDQTLVRIAKELDVKSLEDTLPKLNFDLMKKIFPQLDLDKKGIREVLAKVDAKTKKNIEDVLVKLDRATLRSTMLNLNKDFVSDLDKKTLRNILEELDRDALEKFVTRYGAESITRTIDETTVKELKDILSKLKGETAASVMAAIDDDVLAKLVGKLDRKARTDLVEKVGWDKVRAIMKKQSTDALIDTITDLGVTMDAAALAKLLSKLDKTTLDRAIPKMDKKTLEKVFPNLPADVLTILDTKLLGDALQRIGVGAALDVIPIIDVDTLTDVIPKLDDETIQKVVPKIDEDIMTKVIPTLDDDTIIKIIPIIDPVVLQKIIPDLDDDIIGKIIPIITPYTITKIIPKLPDPQIQRIVPILEGILPPGTIDGIERGLPRKFRRKFKRARRVPMKIPRSKEPEPYKVSFWYPGKRTESKKVDARSFHEALVVGRRIRRIRLRPTEFRVEKLRGKK